jgi:hypothetical protein
MNASEYRLYTETKRHLLAIVEEIDRHLDQQPGVLTDRNMLTRREPAAQQPPRITPAFRSGPRGERNGSSRR